ncbi:DNA polymerase III subunit beta [Deferrisoma palaeochoriense]
MIVQLERDSATRALAQAVSVLERKSTREILEHVLLQARPGTLELRATDLKISLTQAIPCETSSPGAVAVPGRKLYEIFRELPAAPVRLELEENRWLHITAARSSFHIPTERADEFPEFPAAPEEYHPFPAASFTRMLEKTLFSASNDETRPTLCGVYLHAHEDPAGGTETLRMVSTDGHRLTIMEQPTPGVLDMFRDGIILPKKGLGSLKALVDDSGEGFEIAQSGGRIFCRLTNAEMCLTPIDGAFPRYQDVIPSDPRNRVILAKDPFADALRRVSLMTDPDTHSVVFEASEDRVVLRSMNAQAGDSREEIEARLEGEPQKIAFNASYFIEALRHLDGEEVKVEIDQPLAPCLIRSDDDPGYLCVVMPIRID